MQASERWQNVGMGDVEVAMLKQLPRELGLEPLATTSSKSDFLILDDAAVQLDNIALQPTDFSVTRIILIDSTCTPQRVLQASRLGVAGTTSLLKPKMRKGYARPQSPLHSFKNGSSLTVHTQEIFYNQVT